MRVHRSERVGRPVAVEHRLYLPGVKMPDETPVEPSAEKPPVELSAQPAGGES